jgi:hypothetical protein
MSEVILQRVKCYGVGRKTVRPCGGIFTKFGAAYERIGNNLKCRQDFLTWMPSPESDLGGLMYRVRSIQWYLACKKTHPPRTLP